MNPEERYQQWMMAAQRRWEALCHRCGACCGAFDDPCVHLKKDGQGKFSCEIYANRFGARRTVSGKVFQCVSIREKLHQTWPGDEKCGYKILAG